MTNDSAYLIGRKPYLNLMKFLVPIMLIFASSIYLFHSHDIKVIKFEHKSNAPTTKEGFIEDFLNNEIDGPYDPKPLKDFCRSKRRNYQPGLVIKCSPCGGGFGNIKNMMLNCLRFGLEAGGQFEGSFFPAIRLKVLRQWLTTMFARILIHYTRVCISFIFGELVGSAGQTSDTSGGQNLGQASSGRSSLSRPWSRGNISCFLGKSGSITRLKVYINCVWGRMPLLLLLWA